MLAYILAIIIAVGSFSFYMAAFFVPEIHRRQDFFWSGMGMFYAVVLWFCAGRITGAVLLGQTASVALLVWLGWQTLALRRDLTPETVKTPASWRDLQHWLKAGQKKLSQYFQTGSLFAGVSAVWTDIAIAIATMRNRVAGPKGPARSSTVPPLRRSPAYEFETETGKGESIPTEFATVSTSPRSKPPRKDLQQTPVLTKTEPASPASNEPKQPSETTTSGEVSPKTSAEPPPKVSKAEVGKPSESPSQNEPAKTVAETPRPPKVATPSSTRKLPSRPSRLTTVKDWFGDLAQNFRKPKPKRAVIEIPRRPPSIPRPATATKTDSSIKPETTDTNRGDRREAEKQSQKRDQEVDAVDTPKKSEDIDTNWVDDGIDETESQNWPIEEKTLEPDESDTNWPN